jgi:hypothetical protein
MAGLNWKLVAGFKVEANGRFKLEANGRFQIGSALQIGIIFSIAFSTTRHKPGSLSQAGRYPNVEFVNRLLATGEKGGFSSYACLRISLLYIVRRQMIRN